MKIYEIYDYLQSAHFADHVLVGIGTQVGDEKIHVVWTSKKYANDRGPTDFDPNSKEFTVILLADFKLEKVNHLLDNAVQDDIESIAMDFEPGRQTPNALYVWGERAKFVKLFPREWVATSEAYDEAH